MVCVGAVTADRYYLSDAYSEEEAELDGGMLVRQLCKRDGRRPAVFLRLRQETNHSGMETDHSGTETNHSGTETDHSGTETKAHRQTGKTI